MPTDQDIPAAPPIRMITPRFLTQEERDLYHDLGIRFGDTVPENLAEIVDQVRGTAPSSEGLPEGASLPTKKLTDQQRQEILRQIQDVRKASDRVTNPADLMPGVADAIEKMKKERKAGAEDAAPLPDASPAAASESGLDQHPKLCPCCNWDLSRADIVEITEADKTAFTPCWLGGQPYRKTYEFLGGKLRVTFRELSELEKIERNRQIGRDMDSGKYGSPQGLRLGELEAAMARYEFSLQLVGFFAEGSIPTKLPQSLAEWQELLEAEKTPDVSSVLEFSSQWVFSKLVKFESLKVMLYRSVSRFNDLVGRLALLAETDPEGF